MYDTVKAAKEIDELPHASPPAVSEDRLVSQSFKSSIPLPLFSTTNLKIPGGILGLS
jgi:hypothetical protein